MLLFLSLLYYVVIVDCKDSIGYPNPISTEVTTTDMREPLYVPSVCPENHLLYPGNQQTDWICDCAPGYVYYAEKDGCFAVYRQGPCDDGYYLILREGEFRPKCEINPCGKDGIVRYRNICHELEKSGGPCQRESETEPIGVLTVVKSTLKLRCVSSSIPLSLIVVPNSCPPGTRRSNSNDCRSNSRGL
ncbi:protein of unknown function (DUF4789) [Popillia japonica]|uniref:DUF4789 domain-containing protein n=1 Tax=Popillia japonica TaxID=7064 RepID=A0AAW1LDC1_POPJA